MNCLHANKKEKNPLHFIFCVSIFKLMEKTINKVLPFACIVAIAVNAVYKSPLCVAGKTLLNAFPIKI